MLSALSALVKTVAAITAILVVAGGCLLLILNWQERAKERTSYECFVRRMDHHIAEESTNTYHDTCMAASGYMRTSVCSSSELLASPPFCYSRRWF